ncbi:hypothetical protein CLV35_1666 [Motilibacter peucedani]|uniref:Uncharacterized protein n=1 Tax=Motilibacter peucedani TaxID=598650 RepID=A0A420XPL8_9ACTN|nr:hypothetical protein [Motilibacter peucedani]RKS75207.1 hypothetical protein CLV35_1666 [Motilibacter peucedani]
MSEHELESAMDTGSGEGVPGTVPPDGEESMIAAADEVVAAVSDDVPLHRGQVAGADADDPDTPVFREP